MIRKAKIVWLGYIGLALLLSATAAMSQTITGSVLGTVTDPSGAVIAGANVAITNVGTGIIGHSVSDKNGLYSFEFLVIGDYTVTATAPGFETASIGPFHVQIDQIAEWTFLYRPKEFAMVTQQLTPVSELSAYLEAI